jgi:predicted Zn-dependent peptidase
MKRTVLKKNGPHVYVSAKPSDQTHMMIGVPAFSYSDPRRAALVVLSAILGGGMASRLFERVRERMGAGYYISASASSFTDHGFFSASAGVDSARLGESVTAILEEFARIRDVLVPEEELARTLSALVGRIVMGLESSDEYAEFYGVREILNRGIRTPEEVIRDLSRVTAAEVQSVARALFKEENLRISVIGPGHDAAQLEKLLVL